MGWTDWLRQPIDKDQHLLEAQLLALAVSVGMIDAVSYPRYHCFTSNQTGNTVLFSISAFSLIGNSRAETDAQVPATHLGVSLACFCAGVFLQGQTANLLACKSTRLWLLSSSLAQTLCVLIAAWLDHLNEAAATVVEPAAPLGLAAIGLLAVSAGAQVAMSRQLGLNEVPTTQATTAYVDLLLDPAIFAAPLANRSRNRRVAFLLALLLGSFIGAPAYKHVSPALPIASAGGVKLVVTLVFVLSH